MMSQERNHRTYMFMVTTIVRAQRRVFLDIWTQLTSESFDKAYSGKSGSLRQKPHFTISQGTVLFPLGKVRTTFHPQMWDLAVLKMMLYFG